MANSLRQLRLVTFLTIVRFPLVVLFLVGAVSYDQYPATWIFALSLLALICSALTDLLDGKLARKFQVETAFGAHADPLMDKFFYLATLPLLIFVALRNDHTGHAVLLLFITVSFLTRDQWVTFLRSIGSMYNVSGGAQWAGKVRTAINFPLIACIYIYEESPTSIIPGLLIHLFEAVAILINLISVFTYTRHYWPSLKRAAQLQAPKPSTDA